MKSQRLIPGIVVLVAVLSVGCQISAQSTAPATLILHGGRIWTGDPSRPWVEAVAVRDSRISAVGSESEVLSLADSRTTRVNLAGRLAVPGFNDSHIHFLGGAQGLSEVDLFSVRTVAEMQKRVADYARAHPDKPWITGGGWEYTPFVGGLPNKELLDAVVPDRPVLLKAYDGHTSWANSRALKVAGITKETQFSGYGEIVRDPATGEPTGVFKEGAARLLRSKIPPLTRQQKLAALRQGMEFAATLGLTSLQNASGDEEELGLYQELAAGKELSLRISFAISLSPGASEQRIAQIVDLKKRFPGPLIRVNSVKLMLDGVIESHTAAMLQPYADAPSTSGRPTFTQEQLDSLVGRCDRAGLQVWIHAIGDRGVRMALDAYERARSSNGAHDARYRIEHIETVAPADIPRFSSIGVLASMMPIHSDPDTAGVWSKAIGPDRTSRGFAWRSLQKAGARLAFSSDWPASISVSPIRGIYAAVTRQTAEGTPPGGWLPEQRVSLETALSGYTRDAAYASFEEKLKGSLVPGMLADLVVLDRDLFKIPPSEIHKTRVALTVFDGRIVHGRI